MRLNLVSGLTRDTDLYKRSVEKLTALEAEFEKTRAALTKREEQTWQGQKELTAYSDGLDVP